MCRIIGNSFQQEAGASIWSFVVEPWHRPQPRESQSECTTWCSLATSSLVHRADERVPDRLRRPGIVLDLRPAAAVPAPERRLDERDMQERGARLAGEVRRLLERLVGVNDDCIGPKRA